MTSIWKFALEIEDEQSISMPEGAEILCVQEQRGVGCLWAKVNTENPMIDKTIVIRGTGHPFVEEAGKYLGTFQIDGGVLIWHVFEKEVEK